MHPAIQQRFAREPVVGETMTFVGIMPEMGWLFAHWLSPGTTHVIHEGKGNGNFQFSISMVHPTLGETFFQRGLIQLRN